MKNTSRRSAHGRQAALLLAMIAVPLARAQDNTPAAGLRLFGHLTGSGTFLIDEYASIVHTWPSAFWPGTGVELEPDGTLLRAIASAPFFGAGGIGGGLQRMKLDGTITWDYRYDGPGAVSHHDIARLPNGNVLMIAWEEKTVAEAVAAGRNPAFLTPGPFRPDHIIEVQQTGPSSGAIVWEWHVWDHLVQDFDPAQANFGVVADHPERIDVNYPREPVLFGDWNHCNSIGYDPQDDLIYLNSLGQSEFWVIDHSTTTAEAASHGGGRLGRGGDLLYRWGNPEAYGRGLPADRKLVFQHAAKLIPPGRPGAGNVLLFNNRAPGVGGSSVLELELPRDPSGGFVLAPGSGSVYGPAGPVWRYSDGSAFSSQIVSNAERLPNGNTLVCSGAQGWLFELGAQGQIVWEHRTGGPLIFHVHFVEHSLWADNDSVDVAAGGVVTFDLIAGSRHAMKPYMVLGSVSGIQPGIPISGTALTLPLSLDSWFLTSLTGANVYPFGNTLGTLDGSGRAVATVTLPGGILPTVLIGTRFDHAFLSWDPGTGVIDFASQAAGFTLR